MAFLNNNSDKFIQYHNVDIFVDKSDIIKFTNKVFNSSKEFLCVARPRRFGKTLTLSMLNSYYSKNGNSKEIFDELNISKDSGYLEHLNKHNVIQIDVASFYSRYGDDFINRITFDFIEEFNMKYPNILRKEDDKIANVILRINETKGERFIILIDEWDVIFREKPNSKLCDEYIELLRSLFKSIDVSACLDLVYMTGILPIKRYKTQSTLNMFREYNMLNPRNLGEFFGFTENEVKILCNKYNVDFITIKKWYDGYRLNDIEIYNPQSVVEAIEERTFGDYWTSTSATEAVTDYMNYENGKLKEKIVLMLTGEKILVDVSSFRNDFGEINSEDAALTVLIHLGYLSYDESTSTCFIPNYEIKKEFEKGIKDLKDDKNSELSSLYNPILNSKKLYEETLKGNIDFINKILDENHINLTSINNKNNEGVLSVIVKMSYYEASNYYFIRMEDSSSTGRADITFTPKDKEHIPMIIELKMDKDPNVAIKQIKEKEYFNVFDGYKGKILLLGISYDSKTLKHNSKIEYIEI